MDDSAQTDMLKFAITSVEATVRAYDIKAQIALAAFAVTLTPLSQHFGEIRIPGNSLMASAPWLLGAVVVVLALIGAFWPASQVPRGLDYETCEVFFLHNAGRVTVDEFQKKLGKVDLVKELTAELIKLHRIREAKDRRLRFALFLTGCFYSAFFVSVMAKFSL